MYPQTAEPSPYLYPDRKGMAFGLRYWAELQSKFKGSLWRVEIAERDYAGVAEQMPFDGSEPLKITWERRGDEFFVPVKASEVTVNVLCTENFKYTGLFTSDPRRFRVSVLRNNKLFWRGYVVADLYSEAFAAPPYQVSIKAVDGFNLLQSIPFRNLDGTRLTGRKSLWALLTMCVEALELNLPTADWMDLYAEGMSEATSPLRQTYIDMERFYFVYEEPTYRDVLELCLRPFAGQIFQSNGSLHIRRAVALYKEARPASFYEVGTRFPSGMLITHDGREILFGLGDHFVTEAARERIEDMWHGDFHAMGDSTMDITPPLRKVTVSVKNKALDNLIPLMGFYEPAKWHDPYDCLSLTDPTTLQLMGDPDHKDYVLTSASVNVEKCTYGLTLEYALRAHYRRYGRLLSPPREGQEKQIKIQYGVKIVGDNTYYLQEDGQWVAKEYWLEDEVKTSTETSKKIDIQGIPATGRLVFFVKQTLIYDVTSGGRVGDQTGETEAISFCNMTLRLDTGDDYDKALNFDVAVNHANNADMTIQLPIADIPNIPNDRLIYSLYFTNSAGTPTRMWHSRGGNDYNTLVNHLVQCALKYKQRPSRRVSGNMFTGLHLDLNSVIQDSKFLSAGFYVNSIELKALEDDYNTELVEMPGLIRTEIPPAGDDCVQVASLPFTVRTAVLCGNVIILLGTDNKIYAYDAAARATRQLLSYTAAVQLFPADNAFCVVDGNGASAIDYRGVTLHRHAQAGYDLPATYMGSQVCVMNPVYSDPRVSPEQYVIGYYLSRPGYVSSFTPPRRGASYTRFNGTITGLLKSHCVIAVNTDKGAWLFDTRVNEGSFATALPEDAEVKSLSDYFVIENASSTLKIYRRDTFSERTLIKEIAGRAEHADHTMGEVAYAFDGTVSTWTYQTNTIRQIRNAAGRTRPLKGLFYINGELHIVRDNAIYKFIPQP